MKLHQLIILTLLLSWINSFAQFTAVELTGKIGKYPVEMFINQFDRAKAQFKGVYNYKGKKSSLQLSGELKGDCITIEEFFNGKSTGYFYLSKEDVDSLKGFWRAGTKEPLPVSLKFKNNQTANQLVPKDLMDLNKTVSEDVEGKYEVNSYFISDLFYPNIELVTNGGTAIFKKIGKDSLKFFVEMICGPTYHMAYAEGVAVKKGNTYIYKANLSGEENKFCEISFNFKNKKVIAVANASFECGFGARAYLDHELIKVSNKAVFKIDK
jgi:hypothetical protein